MKTKEKTLPRLSRRKVLKTGVAAGVIASAPLYVKNAFSQSGELNIYMWSDYLPQTLRDQFKEETGVTINFTGIGSNEELINKMKATKGRGADIVTPTNMRSPQWEPLELLQAFDLGRIPTQNVNKGMLDVGEEEWNFGGNGSHWLPHIWGTEAVAWRTDKWSPDGGVPSYGDVWADDVSGKMMGRPHSMMVGAGLYMETIGELEPGDMRRAYSSEEAMRPIWRKVTDWVVARKGHVGKFWNDADAQKSGFLQEGMVIGQTWDGPTLAMKSEGQPVTYQAPKEGALAWIDGLALPKAARNIEEVYAFIDFMYRPAVGGETANKTGYNSAVTGSDAFLSEQSKNNFAEAYPGSALDNLWPWPTEPAWYADIRSEYRDEFVAA
ncbi:MAG: extracellular solute-binding protein [Hyphomicrobiales bacterium]|nr:extracellular solute-binding protein [Hyphomicrobiales bacterium]MCY4033224.1 extracellular solute-binding protein [Hyphomicrobiales bacterium]MCY4039254.1 extracellular solute-binding protein [Hyphomicrobiales bacterium]